MFYLGIGSFVIILAVVYYLLQKNSVVIPEDYNAVVVDRSGFIKRVLSTGHHQLKPGLESIEFMFETKNKLAQGCATGLPTTEGILLDMQWSGVFMRNPDLITEKTSQRLRGYQNTEKALQRHVDVILRRLIGAYTLKDLFSPTIRERIERQVTETLKSKLASSGVVFSNFDLLTITPPEEVLHALNQAQAIQTLDGAIRASDRATRDLVANAQQLEDMIEWGKILPPYGRYALAKSSLSS
ncbi:MAG: SPFH domain-containing protein [Chloroflexota bacterium]